MIMEITGFIVNILFFFDSGLKWWGQKQTFGFIPKL
ncbi:hypothetical protein HMPREF1517_1145 [Streptococcus sp. ACS2]|nr:hypothetical protein HMPREF1517_1145 [Streptococcus sp. ACS2]